MPTNEERCEIAARLREWTHSGKYAQKNVYLLDDVVRAVTGIPDGDVDEIMRRLADLIEPEPVCIANVTFTAKQQKELFQRVMDELRENGCPNCGAKVMSE